MGAISLVPHFLLLNVWRSRNYAFQHFLAALSSLAQCHSLQLATCFPRTQKRVWFGCFPKPNQNMGNVFYRVSSFPQTVTAVFTMQLHLHIGVRDVASVLTFVYNSCVNISFPPSTKKNLSLALILVGVQNILNFCISFLPP